MINSYMKTGYKQTEFGVIPEDWKVMKLGDIGEIEMCKRIFNHQTSKSGEVPFYKIGSFGKSADAFITKELYKRYKNKYSYPKKHEILISASGTIGRTASFDGKPAYFQDSNIVWINNDENLVSNSYLSFILRKIQYTSEGSTIKRLYNSIIKSAQFIVPPLPEQTAIANVLSDTDELISKLEKLIAKKKKIKQGAMQELLTGKRRLPEFDKGQDYKQTEVGVIPEDWEVKRLGEVAEFYKGKGLPKSAIDPNGKYKCIHYGELFTKYSEQIKVVASRTKKVTNTFLSRSNDILMPTSDVTPNGLATASAIMEDNVVLGGDILVIRTSKVHAPYFAMLISISKSKILELVTGTTVYHLYGSDMARFTFSLPKYTKEQTAIATVLSDMDLEIEKLEKKLSKLKKIKDGMMQKLLTGQIRLI